MRVIIQSVLILFSQKKNIIQNNNELLFVYGSF